MIPHPVKWRAAILCLLIAAAWADRPALAAAPPDILLLMPDQMRGDSLSILGHSIVRTPHLDAMARDGALFRRAYSPVPSCIPARFALLTGLAPQTSGVVGYAAKPIRTPTLPECLAQAGYATVLVGRKAREVVAETSVTQPLFLTASFYAPHPPLFPPAQYFDAYLKTSLPPVAFGDWVERSKLSPAGDRNGHRVLLEGETLRRAQAGYFGLIEHLDAAVAPLIAEFKARSERAGRPWVIVLTSDHGEMLGDHGYFRKCEPYEGSANVPLIIAGSPALGLARGLQSQQPVGLEDLMPTLIELAEVRLPARVDGLSLVPVLRGGQAKLRDWLHFEHAPCYSQEQAFHALTDGRWKYVWRPKDGREQLFDLVSDPREERDQAVDAAQAAELRQWRSRLVQRLAGRPEGFSDGQRLVAGRPYPPLQVARPNIVFFLVDDLGWQETSVPFHTEVTELNRRYRTPHLQRLAAEGMKFTQAYASAVCSPTRVSALTGMNAARHRVTNWTLRKNRSPDPASQVFEPPAWNLNGVCATAGVERTVHATPLPALLRRAGYRTIHVGKAHFGAKDTPGENPLNLGFDVNIAGHAAGGPGSYWGAKNFSAAWRTNPPDRIWDVPGLDAYHGQDICLTEALTREAIQAVAQAVADRRPFYLYLSHYAVHAPWEKDDRFYQKYLEAGLKPFEATLASMIEGMDRSLGDLLAALERLGVAQETVILFMSDNGSPSQCPRNLPLRGHKLTPYEGGIREPMIVKWPGITRPGTVCPEPLLIEDFFPTLIEVAGVDWGGKTVQQVDGVSFVPLLKGTASASADRALVWHYPHHYDQPPYSALRQGPWKLIYHHLPRRLELFNLEDDLGETRDVANAQPAKVAELARLLAERLRALEAQMPTDKRTGQPIELPDQALGANGRVPRSSD